MSTTDCTSSATSLGQVFLMDRDAGLLCRILGLYAARGLDVRQVDYDHAAQDVMKLSIQVAAAGASTQECVEALRVLVAKVSTLVGVMAAAEHEPGHRAPPRPAPAAAERALALD